MAVVNVKEIYKKLNRSLWEINHGVKGIRETVKMAKKNLLIGEVNFPGAEKKVRVKKVKVAPETEGKADLPDLDKSGYMSKRKKDETAGI